MSNAIIDNEPRHHPSRWLESPIGIYRSVMLCLTPCPPVGRFDLEVMHRRPDDLLIAAQWEADRIWEQRALRFY